MKLYLSHGGITRGRPEEHVWFIVEPRDEPERLARELEGLRRVGRAVIEIDTDEPACRDIAAALVDVWESQAGGECAHGVGAASSCEAEDCAVEPHRPALRKAYDIVGARP